MGIQYEMVAMVNLAKNEGFASGNKLFFDGKKEDILLNIMNPNLHGGNRNFLDWASRFTGDINDLQLLYIRGCNRSLVMKVARNSIVRRCCTDSTKPRKVTI